MILPLFIVCFGTSMYIMNMERDEESQIMDEYTGFWVWDISVNQYLLALGDWDIAFDGPVATLVTVYFIMATFFTMVTAFNMLIAIMGDTFGKVLEGYAHHSREMKLEILKDYMGRLDSVSEGMNFIILVSPTDYNDEEEWGGAIAMVRNAMNKHQESLADKFTARIDLIKE